MEEEFQMLWAEIKKKFSFGTVYRAMVLLELKWRFASENGLPVFAIPEQTYIEQVAYELCLATYKDGAPRQYEGLIAEINKETKVLSLKFCIAEAYTNFNQ